jgi:hypothetical protein
MHLDKLLKDVTGADASWSERQKYLTLHAMLHADGHRDITIKGVEKWFQRGSLPTKWMSRAIQAAEKRGRPVDMKKYI